MTDPAAPGPRIDRLVDPATGQPVHLIYAIPPELLQGGGAPQDGEGISLMHLLARLWSGRRVVLAITLVATVLSVGFSLLLPNVYTAQVTALPPADKGGSGALAQYAGLAAMAGVSLPSAGAATSVDQILAILNSRTLHERLIEAHGLAATYGNPAKRDDLLKRFRNDFSAKSDKKNNAITFSYDHTDPTVAAAVANAAADQLGKLFTAQQQGDATRERTFLEQRLAQADQDRQKALDALATYQREHGAIEIESQTKATVEALGTLQGQLIAQQIELRALREVAGGDDLPQVRLQVERIKGLETEVAKLSGTSSDGALLGLGSLPVIGQGFLARMREVKRQEALSGALVAQVEAAKLTEAREARVITIVDPATVPDLKLSLIHI
jgi:tyrosine-protein kinase Etk/Wzc